LQYLCLAYGDEDGWNSLSGNEKQHVLEMDAVIRQRGNFMSAVKQEVTTVKNWDRNLEVDRRAAARDGLPLAGFSIIEADDVEEVIAMVSNTPCARAKGYIEIRPLLYLGNNDS